MIFIPRERWRVVAPLVVVLGAVVGAGAAVVGQKYLGRSGYGVMIGVNLVLPALAVLAAVLYPRAWAAALMGASAPAAYWLGVTVRVQPRVWTWTPSLLVHTGQPILVAAMAGCAVVGAVAALVARGWSRVGEPDEDRRCACGYLLDGVAGVCPECGRALVS